MLIQCSTHCCGVYEIRNFGEESCEDLEEYFQHVTYPRAFYCVEAPKRKLAFMATTIRSQKGAIKWLEAKGFKPIQTFRNPNTRRIVTVWWMIGPIKPGLPQKAKAKP